MIAAIPLSNKVRGDWASPNSPASAEYIKHAQTLSDLTGCPTRRRTGTNLMGRQCDGMSETGN
jgi:hypothetical protein